MSEEDVLANFEEAMDILEEVSSILSDFRSSSVDEWKEELLGDADEILTEARQAAAKVERRIHKAGLTERLQEQLGELASRLRELEHEYQQAKQWKPTASASSAQDEELEAMVDRETKRQAESAPAPIPAAPAPISTDQTQSSLTAASESDGCMLALWLEEKKASARADVSAPSIVAAHSAATDATATAACGHPAANEVIVQVLLSGICGTDLELIKGYYPYTGVLGHEFVGRVVQTASSESSWLGKRVVGEINASCQQCRQCGKGVHSHCLKRTVMGIVNRNGCHAQYVKVPVHCLHTVPDSVSDEEAVFTEPLAAALEIQEQISIRPTDRVLLIGAGRLGLLIAWTLSLTAADLTVVARHPHQQKLVREGCTRPVKLISEAELSQADYNDSFDIVVEATGSQDGLSAAMRVVCPRGCLVLKSTYAGSISVDMAVIVVKEIRLQGSRCGPFEPALRLMEHKRIPVTRLIEGKYPLSRASEALVHASQRGALKVLFQP